MRTRSALLAVAAFLVVFTFTSNLHAQPLVTIRTVTVGDAGNAADSTGYGAVTNVFAIGKYEVTTWQYAIFLNAVAATDTYSLYHPQMMLHPNITGIIQTGSSGSFSYSSFGGRNRPISFVSWFDAARFCNWLHNGATNGASTETGAYTLNGATTGIITKNPEAKWWIPSEDEWYKAAYYKGGGTNAGYWDYPTQSDSAPGNTIGGATNQANYYAGDFAVTQSPDYSSDQNYPTDAGAFSNSASAYGTFDQGGNMSEWNDAVIGSSRGRRGGSWLESSLQSSVRADRVPTYASTFVGFRVASGASNASVLPQIVSASHSSSGFSMTWTPASNVNVERRLDLNSAAWTTVLSNVTGTSYSDQSTPTGRAFYRLALP